MLLEIKIPILNPQCSYISPPTSGNLYALIVALASINCHVAGVNPRVSLATPPPRLRVRLYVCVRLRLPGYLCSPPCPFATRPACNANGSSKFAFHSKGSPCRGVEYFLINFPRFHGSTSLLHKHFPFRGAIIYNAHAGSINYEINSRLPFNFWG